MVSEVTGSPILFYDGACGLCSRAVRQCIAWQKKESGLRFASLQGETALKVLPANLRTAPFASLVVYTDAQALIELDALRCLAKTLRSPLQEAIVLACSVLFKPLTRWGYRRIVANRHRFPAEHCALETGPQFLS